MAGTWKLDVGRLNRGELEYEISVRTTVDDLSNKPFDELRKILRATFSISSSGLAAPVPSYPYLFKDDHEAVLEELAFLSILVEGYTGIELDNTYKKMSSKFAHTLGRLNRSVITKKEEENLKSVVNSKLLILSQDFLSKCKKAKKPKETIFNLSVLNQSLPGNIPNDSDTESGGSDSELEVSIQNKIKPLPVRDWNIKFSGDGTGESLNAFLKKVEKSRVPRGISRAELFRSAADLFTDKASIWFRANRKWVHDWDNLVAALRAEYLPHNYDRKLFEEIKRRTQGPGESIGMYVAVMANLFSRLTTDIPETAKLEALCENIDPYYQTLFSVC